jgi:hypothetical protein
LAAVEMVVVVKVCRGQIHNFLLSLLPAVVAAGMI